MIQSFSPPRFRPCQWIVASVTALVGAAACSLTLVDGFRARSWLEIPARIVADESETIDAARQRHALRFEDCFQGHGYVGTRLGFSAGTTKAELAMLYQIGREVACYVNPSNPQEAILRREPAVLHWSLPVVFLAIAAGLGYGAKRALVQQRIANVATLYSLERGELVPVDAPHVSA